MNNGNHLNRHLNYPASAYDDQLVLRPPLGVWVTLVFLLRPIIVLVASVTNKVDRVGLLNLVYPDRQWAVAHALAALPAIAVAVAYTRRDPKASAGVRWLWQHGRALLMASLTLNVVFLLYPVLTEHARFATSALIQTTVCALLAYYLFRSPRVADAFADFPTSSPTTASSP